MQQSDAEFSATLGVFFEQVEALVHARKDAADPRTELGMLGLLPEAGVPPIWEDLGPFAWHGLVRGIAKACPRLAVGLSSARLVHECGGDTHADAWAHDAFRVAGEGWRFALPLPPGALSGSVSRWFFCDGERVYATAGACMRLDAEDVPISGASCAGGDVAALDGPVPSVYRDVPAMLSGILQRMWRQCASHAEQRPMFRRCLADFPVVQYRLLLAMADALRADEIAARAALSGFARFAPGHADLLYRLAQEIKIETQQLCGGSGYMKESPYAETLYHTDWCVALFRHMNADTGRMAQSEAQDIESRVGQRLVAAGISQAQALDLLRQVVGLDCRW